MVFCYVIRKIHAESKNSRPSGPSVEVGAWGCKFNQCPGEAALITYTDVLHIYIYTIIHILLYIIFYFLYIVYKCTYPGIHRYIL
jgi:hypothetical protein